MSVKELYEQAIEDIDPLTEEELANLRNKTYFNGDEIEVGDIVLVAFVVDEPRTTDPEVIDDSETTELSLYVALLKEEHFSEFKPYDKSPTNLPIGNTVPILKYIGDGDYFNSENISE